MISTRAAQCLLVLVLVVICLTAWNTPSSALIQSIAEAIPVAPLSAPPDDPHLAPPILASTTAGAPQPNVELRFFYDWNSQDPFNLKGTGMNSRHDPGEPWLAGLSLMYDGQSYTVGDAGIVRLPVPDTAVTTTIAISNTNPSGGQKNLAALGQEFAMTLYEPHRVNYGPRFVIDFRDDNCSRLGSVTACDIGLADGYITSPFKGESYLYSSPWTFDDGLSYENDFANALVNGEVPSPAGGTYHLGELGKLVSGYANTHNGGVPYGFPYLLKDPTLGIIAHMLMDVRNDLGVPVYAPVGGTVCQGNSSRYAICAGDVSIDVNDIRAVPNWQYGLQVVRGQLIGWTDLASNLSGGKVPFPLIHMGSFSHRDRARTLSRFPYLTAEQIVMGARPDPNGQISIAPREQVVVDYDYRVHLPHAPAYTEP